MFGPRGRRLEAFRVGGSALQPSISPDVLYEVEIAHLVFVFKPCSLTLMTSQHLLFQFKGTADINIILRYKIDPCDIIAIVDFRDLRAEWSFRFDIRDRSHYTDIPCNLSGCSMVRMVIGRTMSENDVGARLANYIQKISRVFSFENKNSSGWFIQMRSAPITAAAASASCLRISAISFFAKQVTRPRHWWQPPSSHDHLEQRTWPRSRRTGSPGHLGELRLLIFSTFSSPIQL